jgi:hypothetical protein
MSFIDNKLIKKRGVPLLMLLVSLAYILPFSILFYNQQDLAVLPLDLAISGLVVLAILFLLFVWPLLCGNKIGRFFANFYLVLTGYILIKTFILPTQTGVLDDPAALLAVSAAQRYLSLLLILAIFIGLYVLQIFRRESFRRLITHLFIVACAWTIFVFCSSLFTSTHRVTNTHTNKLDQLLSLSNKQNILIFSFDGLQGDIVTQVLNDNPQLAQEFSGFTYYSDTLGQFPFTRLSTTTTLMGKVTNAKDNQELRNQYITDNITLDMQTSGFATSLYGGHGNSPANKEINSLATGDINTAVSSMVKAFNLGGLRDLWDASTLRIMPVGTSVTMDRDLSHLMAQVILMLTDKPVESIHNESSKFAKQIIFHLQRGPLLRLGYSDIQYFTKHITASSQQTVFQYHHNLMSHPGSVFSKSCKLSDDKVTQNITSTQAQAYCTLSIMSKLITQLKAKQIYDNSLIIFTSDHGVNGSQNRGNKSLIAGKAFNPGSYYGFNWNVGRYIPFIMLKNFNTRTTFKVSDSPVSMLDIAPTICYAVLEYSKCASKNYEGVDLLAPIDKTRERSIFIASDKHEKRHNIAYFNNRRSFKGNAKLGVQKVYQQYDASK